jgi:Protein of unknown function (DUF1571)
MCLNSRNLSANRVCFRELFHLVFLASFVLVGMIPDIVMSQTAARESLAEPVFRPVDAESTPIPLPSEAVPASDAGAPPVESTDRVAGLPSGSLSTPASQLPPAIPAPSLTGETTAAPSTPMDSPETKIARATPHHVESATPVPAHDAAGPADPVAVMDAALQDAEQMLLHIQQTVRDYTCILIKRENVRGTILATEYIQTKVRNRRVENGVTVIPFAVYLKFLKPTDYKGREVLYVEDQRNGSVLVKEGGFRGKFLPTVTLAPTGRFAMQENRYPITELGIENLTRRLLDRSRGESDLSVCKITYREGAKVNGRPCKLLEVRRPTPKSGDAAKIGMNVHLVQVFIDTELNVPIRYGAYDWPDSPGDEPEVVEEYTYHDLKINVGLCDEDFSATNRKYGF